MADFGTSMLFNCKLLNMKYAKYLAMLNKRDIFRFTEIIKNNFSKYFADF